jgi:two-component system, NtrC family, response regulator HydG
MPEPATIYVTDRAPMAANARKNVDLVTRMTLCSPACPMARRAQRAEWARWDAGFWHPAALRVGTALRWHTTCVRTDTRQCPGGHDLDSERAAMSDADTPSSTEPERKKILVVEDDPDIRKILQLFLTEKGLHVKVAEQPAAALEILEQGPVDLILSDVRMPGMSGLELLRHLKERDPEIQLVLMTAYSSVQDAVEAIQLGAADYVEKPIDFRRLERVIAGVLEKRSLEHRTRILQERLRGCVVFEGMIARSQRMLDTCALIERLARYPTTALVTGESGTGKELVARALHRLSPLADRSFVVCNCTTLAPTLLESELFGHVRGSFTGADRDHKGLFETAHGGTIFLDEIGELPLGVQAKLLRVLENREIKRVGSPSPSQIDIRVIAATNRNLADMVAQGTFRDDLYYRLNVGAIHLPPLRSRSEDIEPLCAHFIDTFNQKLGKRVAGVDSAVLDLFLGAPWPGNVRELGNVIERAMIEAKGPVILVEHLPPHLLTLPVSHTSSALEPPMPVAPDLTLEAAERDQIRRALEAAGGRRIAAARLLGLSRRTLYRKLDKYRID